MRLDLRGYGESTTKPEGDQPVDHVSDILETLDERGVRRCHLVGASYGAGVAVETALTKPDVVESLLLCPPGGSLLAELTPDLQSFFDAERAALARHDLDAAGEVNLDWWVVDPTRERAAVAASVIEAVRVMQRHVFETQERWGAVDTTELDPPALDRLKEIRSRTLVLSGGHHLATTKDSVSRVVSGIGDAEEVHWDASAHLPSMEQPEEFLTLLLGWTAATE
jgi:3-oxoadipate enol-lactonase